jgi:hypothetical protein
MKPRPPVLAPIVSRASDSVPAVPSWRYAELVRSLIEVGDPRQAPKYQRHTDTIDNQAGSDCSIDNPIHHAHVDHPFVMDICLKDSRHQLEPA